MPRERYIRQVLGNFLTDAQATVQGYNGRASQKDVADDARTETYNAVKRLPIVGSGNIPDMKNGHIEEFGYVTRCLTVRDPKAQIVGAIYFSINLAAKVCNVNLLGVAPEYQKQHFGAILLQSAVIIAKLYDCKNVSLCSVASAEGFYQGQGLVKRDSRFELSFQDSQSLVQFEKKAQKTQKEFTLQSLSSKVSQMQREVLAFLS